MATALDRTHTERAPSRQRLDCMALYRPRESRQWRTRLHTWLSCSASLALQGICLWSKMRNWVAPGWIPGPGDRAWVCVSSGVGSSARNNVVSRSSPERPWRCQASLETNQTPELWSRQWQMTPEQRGFHFYKSAHKWTRAGHTCMAQHQPDRWSSAENLSVAWSKLQEIRALTPRVDQVSADLPSRIFCYWPTTLDVKIIWFSKMAETGRNIF